MKADTIIAFFAFLVALMSLVFTISQNRASRTHDELSVTPYFRFIVLENRDKLSIDISIKNTGLGPARITDVKMIVGDNPAKISSADDFRRILRELEITKYAKSASYWFEVDDVIGTGERSQILVLEIDRNSTDQGVIEYEKMLENLKQIQIEIAYSSFYHKPAANALLRW